MNGGGSDSLLTYTLASLLASCATLRRAAQRGFSLENPRLGIGPGAHSGQRNSAQARKGPKPQSGSTKFTPPLPRSSYTSFSAGRSRQKFSNQKGTPLVWRAVARNQRQNRGSRPPSWRSLHSGRQVRHLLY